MWGRPRRISGVNWCACRTGSSPPGYGLGSYIGHCRRPTGVGLGQTRVSFQGIAHCRCWGFGRPRNPRTPFQKVGFAPQMGAPRPPGPHRPPTSTMSDHICPNPTPIGRRHCGALARTVYRTSPTIRTPGIPAIALQATATASHLSAVVDHVNRRAFRYGEQAFIFQRVLCDLHWVVNIRCGFRSGRVARRPRISVHTVCGSQALAPVPGQGVHVAARRPNLIFALQCKSHRAASCASGNCGAQLPRTARRSCCGTFCPGRTRRQLVTETWPT